MNHASEVAGLNLVYFVDWIQEKFPYLTRPESVMFAAAILESLPMLFEDNPEAMHGLKDEALMMVRRRKGD